MNFLYVCCYLLCSSYSFLCVPYNFLYVVLYFLYISYNDLYIPYSWIHISYICPRMPYIYIYIYIFTCVYVHTPIQHIDIYSKFLHNNYTRNITNDDSVKFLRIISIRGFVPMVNDTFQIRTIRGAFSNAAGGSGH